jgi:hypothetical protein
MKDLTDLQRKVYKYIRDHPGTQPKDIPWGFADDAADVRLVFQRLIVNGAVRWVNGINELRARLSQDPLAQEDHSDCWPSCRHFEEEDTK